jgi:hypothetical protein
LGWSFEGPIRVDPLVSRGNVIPNAGLIWQ